MVKEIPPPRTALKHGFPLPFPFNAFLTQGEIWSLGTSPTTHALWLLCRCGGLKSGEAPQNLSQSTPPGSEGQPQPPCPAQEGGGWAWGDGKQRQEPPCPVLGARGGREGAKGVHGTQTAPHSTAACSHLPSPSQGSEDLPWPLCHRILKSGRSELAALLCYLFLPLVSLFLISWGVGQRETDKPSAATISLMSKVGQSKGTLARQQGRKLSSGSKSYALGLWSVSFFLVAF